MSLIMENNRQNNNTKKLPTLYKLKRKGGYQPINAQKEKDIMNIKNKFLKEVESNLIEALSVFRKERKHNKGSGDR